MTNQFYRRDSEGNWYSEKDVEELGKFIMENFESVEEAVEAMQNIKQNNEGYYAEKKYKKNKKGYLKEVRKDD